MTQLSELVLHNQNRSLVDVKPISDDLEKSITSKLTEINEPSQLCSLRLPDQTLNVVRVN